jgi:hypothetical protein
MSDNATFATFERSASGQLSRNLKLTEFAEQSLQKGIL